MKHIALFLIVAAILALDVANATTLYARVRKGSGGAEDHIMTLDSQNGAWTEIMQTFKYQSLRVSTMSPDGFYCYSNGVSYTGNVLICANVFEKYLVLSSEPSDFALSLNYDTNMKRLLAFTSNGTNQYLVSWDWNNEQLRQHWTDLGTPKPVLVASALDAKGQIYYWVTRTANFQSYLSWVSVATPYQQPITVPLNCQKLAPYALVYNNETDDLTLYAGQINTWDYTLYAFTIDTTGQCPGVPVNVEHLGPAQVMITYDEDSLFVGQSNNLATVTNGATTYQTLNKFPSSLNVLPSY